MFEITDENDKLLVKKCSIDEAQAWCQNNWPGCCFKEAFDQFVILIDLKCVGYIVLPMYIEDSE